LQSLALEIAERQEKAERDESARHASAVAATQKLVTEAESRARPPRTAPRRSSSAPRPARVESERSAAETLDKAKNLADKTVNEARAEAHRVLSEARRRVGGDHTARPPRGRRPHPSEGRGHLAARTVLSGLAGIMPSVAPAQGGADTKKGKSGDGEKVSA